MTELKQTPLYQVHLAAGAKMVDLAAGICQYSMQGLSKSIKGKRKCRFI